jgi:hypothetical protein
VGRWQCLAGIRRFSNLSGNLTSSSRQLCSAVGPVHRIVSRMVPCVKRVPEAPLSSGWWLGSFGCWMIMLSASVGHTCVG